MIFLVISAAVLVILAIAAGSFYFSDYEYRYRTRMFNRMLHEKETIMAEVLEGMKPLLAKDEHHGSIPETNLFSVAAKNKITILEFLDNNLIAWSDNHFDVPTAFNDSVYHRQFVFLQNGWFLPKTIEAGNEKIVGLLRVRTDYNLKNDIIRSGFEKEYGISENVGFSTSVNASEFHVFNKSGRFLFSLIFPEVKEATGFILIPLLLWAGVFFFILLLCLELVKFLSSKGRGMIAAGLAMAVCSLIYLLLILFGVPAVFTLTELFSPYRFTLNAFIPTLGHLLTLGFLGAFLAGVFFRYAPLPEREEEHDTKDYFLTAMFFIAGALLINLFHYLFSQLITTSNINFQPFQVLELNMFSLAGFVSVFLLLLLPVLYMLRVLRSISQYRTKFVLSAIIPALIILVLLHFHDPETLIPLVIFYLLICGSIWITTKRRTGIFNMTVILSFIFGFYSLYFITILTEEKLNENIKIQSVAFSTENDPEAENLLLDLWPVISGDTVLSAMMRKESFNKNSEDVENVSGYLREKYFLSYFSNFNFNIVLCRNDQPIQVGQDNEMFPNCFKFFDERIKIDGQRLTGTDFYFIDNQRGRSYYLGRMIYESEAGFMNGLFIELYGNVNIFQPGYSALLLDEKYHGYSRLKDYFFAKYINGDLVLRSGEFPYDKTDARYVDKISDYRIFRAEDFRHVLFKNGNATVIISRPVITASDLGISFAYLFAFILLFSNLVVIMIRRPMIKPGSIFNFRQKLQMSYILILLFSFILIGIVVAYLIITGYQTNHHDNIKEKLNSVYLELDSRFSMEKHLGSYWRNSSYTSLNELLISLSNIFNTDINLYGLNGSLIGSSRPEIFYRNLTSTRINTMAQINLADLTMSEYYQREKIGNLEYLSAYIPFFNAEDQLLAYLNLPYFRIQSVLAKEISNLIVAVINFTLILILVTMGIAVVISGRLTAPLSMLGEGLSSFELGKKTEHLSYGGNDEIAELVRQYNRMVDEIEESAKKLANSEREYAWREMARQIAHEIKNPLTPMKLNVQQLLKSWNDKVPGFGEKLEHFAKNQIEYIDNLSSIASSFSSFAKMPGANPAEVDLVEQIKVTLELFRDAEKISFNVKWPDESKVVIYADKEHLNGIFSNLIKNGIQSIPPDRHGIINVVVEVRSDKAVVRISDNGTGIPKDLQKKMFTPNFTTKSSGMGLGLSIVRKYVETAGGRIWFESVADMGTAFFVELPLKYTVERRT